MPLLVKNERLTDCRAWQIDL